MRLALTALLCAFAGLISGCEGMKVGMGYNHSAQQFFLQLERPLDPALKK